MQQFRAQFTIRQLMIGVGSFGLIFALTRGVLTGDVRTIWVLGLVLFTAPLWGSIGLAFLKPAVTRKLFLACCLVVLPVSGFCFVCSAMDEGHLGGGWQALGLGVLWMLVPFGFGDVLSKDFQASRAKNRRKRPCPGASLRPPIVIVALTGFGAMRGGRGPSGQSLSIRADCFARADGSLCPRNGTSRAVDLAQPSV